MHATLHIYDYLCFLDMGLANENVDGESGECT